MADSVIAKINAHIIQAKRDAQAEYEVNSGPFYNWKKADEAIRRLRINLSPGNEGVLQLEKELQRLSLTIPGTCLAEIRGIIRGEVQPRAPLRGAPVPAAARTPALAGIGSSAGRPASGQCLRLWLVGAFEYRLDHARRHPEGWKLQDHWPKSQLNGNDLKYGCDLWEQWYMEVLRILNRITPKRKNWGKCPKKLVSLSDLTSRFPATGAKDYVAHIGVTLNKRLLALCDGIEDQKPAGLAHGGDASAELRPPCDLKERGASWGLLLGLLDILDQGFSHATKDQLIQHAKRRSPTSEYVSAGFRRTPEGWKAVDVLERACLIDRDRKSKRGAGEADEFRLSDSGRTWAQKLQARADGRAVGAPRHMPSASAGTGALADSSARSVACEYCAIGAVQWDSIRLDKAHQIVIDEVHSVVVNGLIQSQCSVEASSVPRRGRGRGRGAVQLAESYKVTINVCPKHPEHVVSCNCSCPHAQKGEYCKHTRALYLHVMDQQRGTLASEPKRRRASQGEARPSNSTPSDESFSNDSISRLSCMGFAVDACVEALQQSGGDVQAAAEALACLPNAEVGESQIRLHVCQKERGRNAEYLAFYRLIEESGDRCGVRVEQHSKTLPVGDFVGVDAEDRVFMIVERKTVRDLCNRSGKNDHARQLSQLRRIAASEAVPFVGFLLEGRPVDANSIMPADGATIRREEDVLKFFARELSQSSPGVGGIAFLMTAGPAETACLLMAYARVISAAIRCGKLRIGSMHIPDLKSVSKIGTDCERRFSKIVNSMKITDFVTMAKKHVPHALLLRGDEERAALDAAPVIASKLRVRSDVRVVVLTCTIGDSPISDWEYLCSAALTMHPITRSHWLPCFGQRCAQALVDALTALSQTVLSCTRSFFEADVEDVSSASSSSSESSSSSSSSASSDKVVTHVVEDKQDRMESRRRFQTLKAGSRSVDLDD